MMTKEFFHRLLDYERRVGSWYLTLGHRATFSRELRAFWHRMAEDERRHVLVLQRSARCAGFAGIRASRFGGSLL